MDKWVARQSLGVALLAVTALVVVGFHVWTYCMFYVALWVMRLNVVDPGAAFMWASIAGFACLLLASLVSSRRHRS